MTCDYVFSYYLGHYNASGEREDTQLSRRKNQLDANAILSGMPITLAVKCFLVP